MQYSENYNLKKPQPNDTADIADINYNTDIIDEKLKENADAIVVIARGNNTVIEAETTEWTQELVLTNFKINGENATKAEAGAVIFAAKDCTVKINLIISETEQQSFIFHLNNYDLESDTLDFVSYGYLGDIHILNVQRIEDSFYFIQVTTQALEQKINKKTNITNTSTNTQYPSAKAVYDFVVGKTKLTYNESENKIRLNGVECSFADVKGLVGQNQNIKVVTDDYGIYLNLLQCNNDIIAFSNSDFVTDNYYLTINKNNQIGFTHSYI